MGMNFASILGDLFLYWYESEFLQKLIQGKKIQEAKICSKVYSMVECDEVIYM
jgi:hypothetical protein